MIDTLNLIVKDEITDWGGGAHITCKQPWPKKLLKICKGTIYMAPFQQSYFGSLDWPANLISCIICKKTEKMLSKKRPLVTWKCLAVWGVSLCGKAKGSEEDEGESCFQAFPL